MSKNKHKFLTFAALMTGATVAVHFINHTIATAAQLKQMLHMKRQRKNGKSILIILQF